MRRSTGKNTNLGHGSNPGGTRGPNRGKKSGRALALAAVVWTIAILLANAVEAVADVRVAPFSDSLTWKALLVSGAAWDGDQTIENWDTARDEMHQLLTAAGVQAEHTRILSSMPRYHGRRVRGVRIRQATESNLGLALESLDFGEGDAAFVFLTSHGVSNQGFALEADHAHDGILSVDELDFLLEEHIGDLPAVILISACYSGQFIQGEDPTYNYYDPGLSITFPTRVILTAARNDRSSFGCGSGSRMPHWDDALLETLRSQPRDADWTDVARKVASAVAGQERGFLESSRSYPQAFVGEAVDPRVHRLVRRIAQAVRRSPVS